MKKIFSKVQPDLLLHIVLHDDFTPGSRENIGAPEEALQVSTICAVPETSYRAHKHLWKDSPNRHITQETWIIVAGEVKATYYDIDGAEINSVTLGAGDCSITYRGGHAYSILPGKIARIYEVKSGPYHGQAADKEFLR